MAKTNLTAQLHKKKQQPLSVVPKEASTIKLVNFRLNTNAIRQLKQLALDHDTSSQDLFCEAMDDLFKKYGLPTISK